MAWEEIYMPTEAEAAQHMREHKKRARFLVDECLGEGTVELLSAAGWSVKGVWELGLCGRDDTDVMAQAWKERRIILTHDDDFLDTRRFPEHRNPGVVVLPGADGDEGVLTRALGQFISLVGNFPDLYKGSWMRMAQDGTFIVTARDSHEGIVQTTRYRFPKHGAPLMERL